MPHTWEAALAAYRYRVQLSTYQHRHLHPGWFDHDLPIGDREQTMNFEGRFRGMSHANIEAWIEVVYWKLHSQPLVRNGTTRRIFESFIDRNIGCAALTEALSNYIAAPSRETFDAFRILFDFQTPVIAIVATFPAFLDPNNHPMVDKRIAQWVNANREEHNTSDPNGPQLSEFPLNGVLQMNAFDSFQNWRRWCVHTADKLSGRTLMNWRARDIEMAVFQTWGGHPMLYLNPLPPL